MQKSFIVLETLGSLETINQTSYQVRESVKTAQTKVKAKQENVSGVLLPTFEMYTDGQNGKNCINSSCSF
jgi:hypothetical protein